MTRVLFSFTSSALVIGFFEVAYNVSEGNGSVSMSFGVLSGTLKISVNVSVTTMDGSAVCKSCQENDGSSLLL